MHKQHAANAAAAKAEAERKAAEAAAEIAHAQEHAAAAARAEAEMAAAAAAEAISLANSQATDAATKANQYEVEVAARMRPDFEALAQADVTRLSEVIARRIDEARMLELKVVTMAAHLASAEASLAHARMEEWAAESAASSALDKTVNQFLTNAEAEAARANEEALAKTQVAVAARPS